MRGRVLALLVTTFLAAIAHAQTVTPTAHGILVAHDARIELFDENGTSLWSADGVQNATAAATDGDRVVVLDPLANDVVIADVANRRAQRVAAGETPVAAVFANGSAYILSRDAGTLTRVDRNGAAQTIGVAGDMLAAANGRVYVYSRVGGTLQEIEGTTVKRTASVARFASDFRIDGHVAYFVQPRDGRIRTFDLNSWKSGDDIAVGAVPTSVAFVGGGTALTARILAVADPSAKRIWLTEATQSTTAAVARGFLRGFLGLGLFGGPSSAFPTGVDRVTTAGNVWAAYDSSSGTLYRFTRKKSSVVATSVSPQGFAATARGIAFWSGGRLHVAR